MFESIADLFKEGSPLMEILDALKALLPYILVIVLLVWIIEVLPYILILLILVFLLGMGAG